MLLDRFLNQSRALDVASGSMADVDDVLPDRPVAKSVVERGNAGNGRGRDVGQTAHTLQCLRGQVAIVLLDRLQDRHHRFGATADIVDDARYRFKIELCF